jgi:hypothetical protein
MPHAGDAAVTARSPKRAPRPLDTGLMAKAGELPLSGFQSFSVRGSEGNDRDGGGREERGDERAARQRFGLFIIFIHRRILPFIELVRLDFDRNPACRQGWATPSLRADSGLHMDG